MQQNLFSPNFRIILLGAMPLPADDVEAIAEEWLAYFLVDHANEVKELHEATLTVATDGGLLMLFMSEDGGAIAVMHQASGKSDFGWVHSAAEISSLLGLDHTLPVR